MDLSEQIQKVPASKRKEVTKQIGDWIVDNIVTYLDKSNTPVKDGQFKKSLSKEYSKATGKKKADLHLEGTMLSSLVVDSFRDKVTIKITEPTQKKKAYNHNVGDTLPVRKFLPDDAQDETFKKPILDGISRIIKDASEG